MSYKYDMKNGATLEVTWDGPYSWPNFEPENNLPPIPNLQGVYLQTFEYENGYLIYGAGLTRRPISTRFIEHAREYMNGKYTVLDTDAARQGIRKEVWHGWGYARKNREEFEEKKMAIRDSVRKQLSEFRIFVANVEGVRVHERLEASMMNNLYKQPPPFCNFPDRGMQLSPRWPSEEKIIVKNNCASLLHGVPILLEI